MRFGHWMGKMAGEWSSLTIQKEVAEAVAVVVAVVAAVVKTSSVMNAVKLVILHENVACELGHGV